MSSPKQIVEKGTRPACLRPGLSDAEIARFEKSLPGALPSEIKQLLSYSAGFDVDSREIVKSRHVDEIVPVLFTGVGRVGFSEVLPCPVALLGDGCGKFWVVDVGPSGDWGAILYICHDPPVVAIQAAHISDFLDQVLNPGLSHHALEFVRNEGTTRIWRKDPWLLSAQNAQTAADSVLSKFAEQVPGNFCIADLRSKAVGSGFVWGKVGPDTDIRRNGTDLMFAIEQKRSGFLKRMFFL